MLQKIKAGFTLIELMIVVAIIGLLAALAIPNFIKFQARSRQSEAKSNLKAMFTAQKSYYGDKQCYCDAMGVIGFLPERNNRYMYTLSPTLSNELLRTTASDPSEAVGAPVDCGALTAIGTSYNTVQEDQFKWGIPAPAYAAASIATSTYVVNVGTAVPVIPGMGVDDNSKGCPSGQCEFAGGATGNIDNDTTYDQWTIATQGGADTVAGNFAEGEPVNTVNDVNQ